MSDLKKDIQSGKIKALKLIETPIDAIEGNYYALMYEKPREITRFDDEKFYLKTLRSPLQGYYELVGGAYAIKSLVLARNYQEWTEAEAYYSAFKYYDGKKLISEVEIPNAVYEKDRIHRTVYQVIR